MSILNKLMDTMRLTENDDDYFDEEDYEEEKPVIKKRSFGKRDEEMDDYRHEEESKPRFLPRSSNNKVVQMRRSMEVLCSTILTHRSIGPILGRSSMILRKKMGKRMIFCRSGWRIWIFDRRTAWLRR